MLRILSFTGSYTILQSIDMADENKIGGGKNNDNKTNLSKLFTSKKSTKAGYLTSRGAKKGGGNTKKDVEVTRDSDYLIPAIKKAFNHLRYAFT